MLEARRAPLQPLSMAERALGSANGSSIGRAGGSEGDLVLFGSSPRKALAHTGTHRRGSIVGGAGVTRSGRIIPSGLKPDPGITIDPSELGGWVGGWGMW
jgi:hypothetical protein